MSRVFFTPTPLVCLTAYVEMDGRRKLQIIARFFNDIYIPINQIYMPSSLNIPARSF